MSKSNFIPGEQAQGLLEEIAGWQQAVTTIVIHAGSVFEFKGPFPAGVNGHGYYNLKGESGFEGHLNLTEVAKITLQDKPHRGRDSYAFVFEHSNGEVIFKIFLGRDDAGDIIAEQLQRFKAIQQTYSV
jgi:hypothetical protein